jgi:hypothetical protein
MLSVTRTGTTGKAVGAELRALTGQQQPRITAQALTFASQRAQRAIVDEMPRVFAGGASRYSLNSTRIEPATVDKLFARVAVKDIASSGNLPEDYLFPSVFSGSRKEKRFERALRFDGLLRTGERAIPGDFAPLDAQGNYKVGQLRTLLRSLKGIKRVNPSAADRSFGTRSPGRTRGDLFVGQPGGRGQAGVYRRVGAGRAGNKALQPLLIFVTKAPRYTQRLDFEGIARTTAQREFPEVFARLLRKATGAA